MSKNSRETGNRYNGAVKSRLFESRKGVNEKVKSTAAVAVTYFPLLQVQLRKADS
jgi:hypothetical protein